jgi:hypothetical protein
VEGAGGSAGFASLKWNGDPGVAGPEGPGCAENGEAGMGPGEKKPTDSFGLISVDEGLGMTKPPPAAPGSA